MSAMKKAIKNSNASLAEKRAQIEEALRKKRECEKKAQSVVEYLTENTVDKDWLLENVKFISQSHYQDVTEERAISYLCGYPLCPNEIDVNKIPPKKWMISTKSNRVFELTQRKNFCSNVCYEKSTHFHKQLLTSPLWLRKEEDIPTFTLLSNAKGLCGEEVKVISIVKPDDEGDEEMTSLNSPMKKMDVNESRELIPIARTKPEKQVEFDRNPVEFVTRTLQQWFTTTSRNYIREGIVEEKTLPTFEQEKFQSQYQALCARLDVQDMQDKAADERLLQEGKRQLKPSVSYEDLKREAKRLNLKVRAYFGGQLDYAEDSDDEDDAEEAKPDKEDEGEYFVTPLVDATSQNALRRRVVMQHLEKCIPPLLFKIGLSFDDVRSDLGNLVTTFNLSADTVTFRSNENNLLSIMLLAMVALRNVNVKKRLGEDESKRFTEDILSLYQLDDAFVDNLIGNLMTKCLST